MHGTTEAHALKMWNKRSPFISEDAAKNFVKDYLGIRSLIIPNELRRGGRAETRTT